MAFRFMLAGATILQVFLLGSAVPRALVSHGEVGASFLETGVGDNVGCVEKDNTNTVNTNNCRVRPESCLGFQKEDSITVKFDATGKFLGTGVGGSISFPITIPKGCENHAAEVESCGYSSGENFGSGSGDIVHLRETDCGSHKEDDCDDPILARIEIPLDAVPEWAPAVIKAKFPMTVPIPNMRKCIPLEEPDTITCDGRDATNSGTSYKVPDTCCF